MNEQSSERIALYNTVAESLSNLSDHKLLTLLQSTENIYSGIGGKATILEIAGVKIFTKKIPLTALEMQPENVRSTANLFNLPMACHIGVGSPGFGAWRELLVHETTTNWVLSNQCGNFPIMYHWRVLPSTHQLHQLTNEEMKNLDEQVEYWDNSSEVRNRLEATRNSTTDLLVFLEYIPERLFDWLKRKLLTGGQTAIDAVSFIDVKLKQTNAFMNANGLIHFDAHFANILADDNAIYHGDFGLSLYDKFDLLKNERDLFAKFKSYDNASSFTNLLHCIITGVYNRDPWEITLNDYLGGKLAQLELPITRIIERYSKIALTMDGYYKNMQKVSKSTAYPAKEIHALLDNADIIIETGRLHLRQWRISDIPVLARINQDPKVMEHFTAPKTYAETEAFVLANMQLCDQGEPFLFAVEERKSSALIGFVGIYQVGSEMPFAPAVEIGWRLSVKYWGQGYAFEAAKAVVDYAFNELGITELVSFTVPGNTRSRKLMERLGLVHEPENDFPHPQITPGHKISKHVFYRLISPHIKIDQLKPDSALVEALKNEVFEFGANSGVVSGTFASLKESKKFTAKIISERFDGKPKQQHCFVIALDGKMVGRAWLMERNVDILKPDSEPDMRLAYIKIDEQYQRRGIAKVAIKLLETYTIEKGFKKMSLNVFSNLPNAKRLYLKLGFSVHHDTEKDGQIVNTEMIKNL